jgi:UDP-N-acetylmuramate--alanine ligase
MTDIDLFQLSRQGPIHFMGIGGAGMCALAEMLRGGGGHVTGCDLQPNRAVRNLQGEGVEVWEEHADDHVAEAAALVMTAAVPADHPELAAARARGIPVLKRAEALAAIANRGIVVGVAGTHGKTTTTAITTTVLAAAGRDPTGFVGGRVPAWGGNLRRGSDRLFVVEADEFDRSFLHLRPNAAVVTTLEADHLDIYASLGEIEDAFAQYLDSVPDDGLIAACADDAGVGRLLPRLGGQDRIVTYGLNAGAMLRAEEVSVRDGQMHFHVRERRGAPRRGRARPAREATTCGTPWPLIAVARWMGIEWPAIREGLASFRGVERRFERVGEEAGIEFVDDYAHHPTELRATLEAARHAFPKRRIVAVFQPHLYSRTRDFHGEFGEALALADLAVVTDVFPARERPIPGVTGALVADAARHAGVTVVYVDERAAVPAQVASRLREGDVCLTLGSGQPGRRGPGDHGAGRRGGSGEQPPPPPPGRSPARRLRPGVARATRLAARAGAASGVRGGAGGDPRSGPAGAAGGARGDAAAGG